MKIFISLPMGNMTTREFCRARQEAEKAVKGILTKQRKDSGKNFDSEKEAAEKVEKETEFLDSFCEDFESDRKTHAAKNVSLLLSSDGVYFADGWKKSAECKAEHLQAETFDIKILAD